MPNLLGLLTNLNYLERNKILFQATRIYDQIIDYLNGHSAAIKKYGLYPGMVSALRKAKETKTAPDDSVLKTVKIMPNLFSRRAATDRELATVEASGSMQAPLDVIRSIDKSRLTVKGGNSYRVPELRNFANQLNVKGANKMLKAELVGRISEIMSNF